MTDPAAPIDVKKFRESVTRVLQQQAQPFPKLAKELDELQDELETLQKAGTDKEAIAEARKKRDDKRKQIEACVRNLNVQKAITQPIQKPADSKVDFKKLLEPLPKIARDIIENQGVPLGKNGVLKPDVDFDFSKGKFNKGGGIIEWKLP